MMNGRPLTSNRFMAIVIVALSLSVAPNVSPAQSPNARSDIESLYRQIEQTGQPPTRKARNRIFSSSLRSLMAREQDLARRSGEIGLDWDVIVNGQDLDRFRFISARDLFVEGKRAEVQVEFHNGESQHARIDMIHEGGTWKINNIRYEGADGYDLRKILNENINRFSSMR